MKYKVSVCGVPLILGQTQLDILVTAVQDAYQISEKHVGTNKGSQGYNNSYIPTIEVKQPHDWLGVTIVADDFIEATKLAMKLDTGEP
jgi:heme-binding NEAT domain protein